MQPWQLSSVSPVLGVLQFPVLVQRRQALFSLGIFEHHLVALRTFKCADIPENSVQRIRDAHHRIFALRAIGPCHDETTFEYRGCYSATTPSILSGPQPVLCRRARTWSIRRSADQDRCDRIRCGSASCDPDTSGSAAVRSELAMVRGEHKFQACDAPAYVARACGTPGSRYCGCDGTSMPHRAGSC
jgi:hypothetical protein